MSDADCPRQLTLFGEEGVEGVTVPLEAVDHNLLQWDLFCHQAEQRMAWYEVGLLDTMRNSALYSPRRADVLTLAHNALRPDVTIYEVKRTRADFLSDKKWREYLPHCSRFYFATPRGLLKRAELPEEVGLIVRGEDHWHGVKAAPRRNAGPNVSEFAMMLVFRQYECHRPLRHIYSLIGRLRAEYYRSDLNDEPWIDRLEKAERLWNDAQAMIDELQLTIAKIQAEREKLMAREGL